MARKTENGFRLWYAITLAWQLGFFIAIPIVGLLLLGIWGDEKLGTKPLLIIVGIIAGFAISVYEVRHLLGSLIEKRND